MKCKFKPTNQQIKHLCSKSYSSNILIPSAWTDETVWHDGKSGHMPEYSRLQNEVAILALKIEYYNVCQMHTYSAWNIVSAQ